MKTPVLLPIVAVALVGCTTPARTVSMPANPADDLVRARLGQTIAVGGPKVTPLRVIEDSRCPTTVVCVWAGRIRVSVRIDLGSGSQIREMDQGQPIRVADGMLELVDVQPSRNPPAASIKPVAQTFGFRFMGGL